METERSSQCPICKQAASELPNRRSGDHHFFKCPRCSVYEIGGMYADLLRPAEPEHVLSGVIRHANECGEIPCMLTQWNVNDFLNREPRTQAEKAKQLLDVISKKAPRPGQVAELYGETDYPLVYGADASELRFFLNLLVEQRKIKIKETDGRFECEITPTGWETLEADSPPAPESRSQAMSDDAPTLKVPTAFVSYSWDNETHKDWVKRLATRLRQDGVDVRLDQWAVAPGDSLTQFMETAVRENDFVLIVLTPNYKRKSDARHGGVGYEGSIMTGEVFAGKEHRKFIPVLREGDRRNASPSWLGGKYGVDLTGDPYSDDQYHDLLISLLGMREQAPPIGKRKPSSDENQPVATPSPAAETGPIKIVGIVANEVGTPRNDGTRGCALYRVPLRLSRTPSHEWAERFVQSWDHPPSFSLRHRPKIARVVGDRIILDGTTVEELEEVHRHTLKLVVETVNDLMEHEEQQRMRADRESERHRQHKQSIEEAAKRINFD